jgi:type IV secretory pathway TraG/TraD family ATPase VirD4
MESKKGGMSDSDNEMAGRLLLMLAVGVALVILIMASPILIGGFLMGLTWYGAYIEGGEPNGEKLAWPIGITLLGFMYFAGAPVFLTGHLPGVLFTDFGEWTSRQVWSAVGALNELLPNKLMIRHLTAGEVRLYLWSFVPVGFMSLIYLHFKGAGRGGFIYHAWLYLFTPLRVLAAFWWSVPVLAFLVLATTRFHGPRWLSQGLCFLTVGIAIYSVLLHVRMEKKLKADDSLEKTDEPIIVGHEKGRPGKLVKISDDVLNHHVHIVGASGFGKSVLLSHVIQNRIRSGSGLMFVDLKADFETIRQVVSTAKASNRMEDLYIFSCGNPEISSPYNVLANGTAGQLKDRIMGSLSWSEEFYKNEASSFLLKLLRGLTYLRDKTGATFDLGTVLNATTNSKAIEAIVDQLPEIEIELKSQLEDLANSLGRPDKFKALQGLRSQLEALMLSDVGELLKANPNGIDIFEAIRAKKIVYVLLDSRTYGESSRALGKLILQDLKAASARVDAEIPRDARVPFTVVVDEFSDLATEEFLGFLDRARSSKIGVVVAHQEIADLSRISPEFSHRLMNSTSTLFAFLQKVPETSDLIASISGTKTTKKVTEQAKDNWLFGDEKTGMKSIREVEEFIIHPNTVRSLAVGECVMVQKYPRSMSMIIKVKPETTNYLRDEEVRRILEGRRTAHVVRAFPTTRRTAPQVAHLAATERSELRANEAKF